MFLKSLGPGLITGASAPKAAEALKPIAGDFAHLLFATGIIGTGLLAVPILAGSAAYAVAETFRMREGLYLKLRQAHGFYAVMALSTLIGFAMNLIGVNPMKALSAEGLWIRSCHPGTGPFLQPLSPGEKLASSRPFPAD